MDNEYLADEPRAPDLFEGKPPPRIEIKGVAAYVVAYAARSESYRNLDLYYLHAFGSKASMETIRAFGMEPQGTILRIEEPAEDEGQADRVKELKIPPAVRKGWKVHPTVHVDVPGGRVYTTYETVIQHGSVEFNHDPLSKCEWDPEHFILLARNEGEVPQRFYEKLAARSELPIHRAFAKPLWDDLSEQGTPYGRKPIAKLQSHGVVAYEVNVDDDLLAKTVKRLGGEGLLPSAEAILDIPEPDRFADNAELYEEASFNPNPMVPAGAY